MLYPLKQLINRLRLRFKTYLATQHDSAFNTSLRDMQSSIHAEVWLHLYNIA